MNTPVTHIEDPQLPLPSYHEQVHELAAMHAELTYIYQQAEELQVSNEALVQNIGAALKGVSSTLSRSLLSVKNIFKGIRKSNILFHKSELGQYKKTSPLKYRAVRSSLYEHVKTIQGIMIPTELSSSYLVATTRVCDLVTYMSMPYSGYSILDDVNKLRTLVKSKNADPLVYGRLYSSMMEVLNYNNTKDSYAELMTSYDTSPKRKTVTNLTFAQVFKSMQEFHTVDDLLGNHHTELKNATTVEDTVLAVEKTFDEIIKLVTQYLSTEKNTVMAIANIADLVSIYFNAYGYSCFRLMELIHNHVLNLETLGDHV